MKLAVAVHLKDIVRPLLERAPIALDHARPMTAVDGIAEHLDRAGERGADSLQDLPGAVSRAVVDNDDVERPDVRAQRPVDLLQEPPDPLRLVIRRDRDRDRRLLHRLALHEAAMLLLSLSR